MLDHLTTLKGGRIESPRRYPIGPGIAGIQARDIGAVTISGPSVTNPGTMD